MSWSLDQLTQETPGVVGVGSDIERFVERAERVWMVVQVDLQAAGVDRGDAGRFRLPDPGDRRDLAREKQALALRVNCPRPRLQDAAARCPPALYASDCSKQACRNAVRLLGQRRSALTLSRLRCQRNRGGTQQLGGRLVRHDPKRNHEA